MQRKLLILGCAILTAMCVYSLISEIVLGGTPQVIAVLSAFSVFFFVYGLMLLYGKENKEDKIV